MKTTFDLKEVQAHDDQTERHPHGGVIFIKGDKGDHAYIVKSGQVDIREGGRVLESMMPGELFGEMTLIDSSPRSASAVAVGDTEIVAIDRATFHVLVRDVPDFAITVMRLMARRLRVTTASGRDPEAFLPLVGEQLGKSA